MSASMFYMLFNVEVSPGKGSQGSVECSCRKIVNSRYVILVQRVLLFFL
jgi:hypothetical protein